MNKQIYTELEPPPSIVILSLIKFRTKNQGHHSLVLDQPTLALLRIKLINLDDTPL
jgi:hypothetical protein